jgi:rhomboid protease GluP
MSISHQKKIRAATTLLFILFLVIYFLSTTGKFDFGDDFGFVLEGAGSKRVFEHFEIYRVFSSAFIHANFFHLFMNLLILGAVGDVLEKAVSSLRFLNIFFIATLSGFFTFFLFSYDEFGVGASGGIYGLWGAYLCLKFKYEELLPGSVNAGTTNTLIWLLALQFTLEIFVFENIGISNHIGGFVAGFLYLYFALLGAKLETIDQPVMVEKILCGGLVLSFAAGLGCFLSRYYGFI